MASSTPSPRRRSGAAGSFVARSTPLLLSASVAGCHAITGLDDLWLRDETAASTVAASTATSGSTGTGGTPGVGGTGGAGGSGGAGGFPCDLDGGLSYAQTVLCDKPAAYWRFEELNPSDAKDEMGAYPAQYIGTVTFGPDGIAGSNAPTFHAGGEGYVKVGDAFDFVGNEPYSFEAWVKPMATVPDFAGIVGKLLEGPMTQKQGYTLGLSTNGLFAARVRDNVTEGVSVGSPAEGEFTHVVMTYDGTTLKVYKNGKLAEGLESTPPIIARDTPLTIGSYHDWAYFNGVIDEVAVYEKALGDTRILAHYQAGIAN